MNSPNRHCYLMGERELMASVAVIDARLVVGMAPVGIKPAAMGKSRCRRANRQDARDNQCE